MIIIIIMVSLLSIDELTYTKHLNAERGTRDEEGLMSKRLHTFIERKVLVIILKVKMFRKVGWKRGNSQNYNN